MKASMFIAIAALSLASCTDYLTPEGEVVEREIEIPQSINEIEIGDGMTLVLSDDVPAGKAVIRTHGNVQPYIKAEIRGDEVIFTVNAHRFKDLEVTVSASLGQYDDFTASGGAAIYSDGALSLANGSFNVSGGSRATFSGTCTNADIECSGGSVLHGYDLSVQNAEVEISGGSRLEITVTQSLTGENSGGSAISYDGSPAILNVNNTGGSQTTPRN